jgi:hypothetical protein
MENENGFGLDFSRVSPSTHKRLELLQIRDMKACERRAEKKRKIKESRKKTPQQGFFNTYVNGKIIPNEKYDRLHPGLFE